MIFSFQTDFAQVEYSDLLGGCGKKMPMMKAAQNYAGLRRTPNAVSSDGMRTGAVPSLHALPLEHLPCLGWFLPLCHSHLVGPPAIVGGGCGGCRGAAGLMCVPSLVFLRWLTGGCTGRRCQNPPHSPHAASAKLVTKSSARVPAQIVAFVTACAPHNLVQLGRNLSFLLCEHDRHASI